MLIHAEPCGASPVTSASGPAVLQHFEDVDKSVIEGHVIPQHVLFTSPTPNEKPYATAAFSENMQVTISFSTDHKKRKSESNRTAKLTRG